MASDRDTPSREMRYGEWITTRRTSEGLTIKALAERIGMDRFYLADIERGRRLPWQDVSDQIADGIGVNRELFWRRAALERFWAKVDKSGDCWEWQGPRDYKGYGIVRVDGRKTGSRTGAHRLIWTLLNGPIPEGLYVCHTCDNPPCVNPDHLRLGTQADNIADRCAKGRTRTGRMLGEDHPGHKLSADDVLEMRRGWRSGMSIVDLAAWYDIGYGTAWQILHGKLWAHLPLDGKAA